MTPLRSSRHAVARFTAFAAVTLAILVCSTQASARQASANLLQNGDAESGPAAATGPQVVPPSGWQTTGSFTAAAYGTQGLPSAPPGGGSNLFAGGPGEPLSTASQTVDVSSSASAIDAGTMQVTLSALLGGWEGQNDSATVRAVFFNANELLLDSFAIGPVTASDRGNKTVLLPRSKSALVPAGTRSIRVVIAAQRSTGVYNDGYADNVSLTLSPFKPVQGHYRFGFRIFDRSSNLSAGSSGSFTTQGQPNSAGDVKVVKVVARDLRLGWTYRAGKYSVTLRFRGDGMYDPASQLLRLQLTIRNANVSGCHAGGPAAILINKPGDVTLYFCGDRIAFMAPARSSAWISQG